MSSVNHRDAEAPRKKELERISLVKSLFSVSLCLCGFSAALAAILLAHEPITTKLTWSREISRIIYARCLDCHRNGGPAPMSLVTYQQARPWAKGIKEQVLNRRMPPWGAVKGFGDFRNERALSQYEINLIATWVEGGAPEGDAALMPAVPPPSTPEPFLSAHVIEVRGSTVLGHGVRLLAIEPVAPSEISSARIEAERPDGSVEPLLWLLDYRNELQTQYDYRDPIGLPKGTRITSNPPVTIRLSVE